MFDWGKLFNAGMQMFSHIRFPGKYGFIDDFINIGDTVMGLDPFSGGHLPMEVQLIFLVNSITLFPIMF
ncbi:MAG: hypothetical protein Ct9H300mP29_6350 [Candidatus Neomarinimicrobiota bacterium]|nr:MAG: hypothetical protein Ct9H300mP29_6350 [Candidatus Neomarinimicrobiota bacterium]